MISLYDDHHNDDMMMMTSCQDHILTENGLYGPEHYTVNLIGDVTMQDNERRTREIELLSRWKLDG